MTAVPRGAVIVGVDGSEAADAAVAAGALGGAASRCHAAPRPWLHRDRPALRLRVRPVPERPVRRGRTGAEDARGHRRVPRRAPPRAGGPHEPGARARRGHSHRRRHPRLARRGRLAGRGRGSAGRLRQRAARRRLPRPAARRALRRGPRPGRRGRGRRPVVVGIDGAPGDGTSARGAPRGDPPSGGESGGGAPEGDASGGDPVLDFAFDQARARRAPLLALFASLSPAASAAATARIAGEAGLAATGSGTPTSRWRCGWGGRCGRRWRGWRRPRGRGCSSSGATAGTCSPGVSWPRSATLYYGRRPARWP